MDKYEYLFKNPKVICMDYRTISHDKDGKRIGQKVLCIGVIKEDLGTELPKIAVYETSTKSVKVPVYVFVEGEIKALS